MTFWGRYQRELSVAATYAVLLLRFYVFTPSFFQAQFRHVGRAPVLVAAVGMMLVILHAISTFRSVPNSRSAVSWPVWRQSRLPHARGRGDDDITSADYSARSMACSRPAWACRRLWSRWPRW